MRLSPENKTQFGFAISLTAVVCFGIVAAWSASRNSETFRQVNDIRQTVECCERIFAHMLEIETEMRGFVGSGDEKFLDPYVEGATSIHESFGMAQRLTRHNPKQRVQLQMLEPLIQEKLAFVGETIQIYRKGDRNGARQRIASGQGRRMMDQIRTVIAQVEAEENVEMRTRLAEEETATHTTVVIIIVSGLISLALVGLAGLTVRHDFWKRKEVEADLHVASERLALATRATNVGIWDWNIADEKLFWDDATYEIYGVTRDQFVPSYEAFEAMVHPDDRQRVREDVQSAVRGEKEYALEFRVVWPDKSFRYLETKATILRDDSGKPVRMLGTNWDVTQRKRVEEALRQSEETMRMMTESIPQMIWMCRPDGWNIYINQKWVDYTGQSAKECSGHGWNKPFHPDDQLRAWNAWKLATETGGAYDLECRLRRTDGAYRWFLIRGLPVRDAQGAILKWFGTCTDIHDRKKDEQEIKALNARLEQQAANLEKEVCERTAKLSASIKSLETLTYSMAHDLRAPVCAMAGL
ncbi:MAG: PAS domain-containing protein, partial [Limisphaerales bacterium]